MSQCPASFGVKWSMQGNSSRAVLPMTRCQCGIHCESSAWAHGASKRRWAPQTSRDTPKGVQKASMNETVLVPMCRSTREWVCGCAQLIVRDVALISLRFQFGSVVIVLLALCTLFHFSMSLDALRPQRIILIKIFIRSLPFRKLFHTVMEKVLKQQHPDA